MLSDIDRRGYFILARLKSSVSDLGVDIKLVPGRGWIIMTTEMLRFRLYPSLSLMFYN